MTRTVNDSRLPGLVCFGPLHDCYSGGGRRRVLSDGSKGFWTVLTGRVGAPGRAAAGRSAKVFVRGLKPKLLLHASTVGQQFFLPSRRPEISPRTNGEGAPESARSARVLNNPKIITRLAATVGR